MTDARLRQRLLQDDPAALIAEAAALRDAGHGTVQTWSPKVFIPLTQLCRDRCHYCTFAKPPKPGIPAYLSPDEVLAIARAGRDAGCTEALFTLGDKPELRHAEAREALAALGHPTTLSYLAAMAGRVRDETGLLPHLNAGVMGADDLAALRDVSVSQGLMLETVSERLSAKGGAHYRSPDKAPAARLATIAAAGAARVPFTTGILIGIGETRDERIDALLAIRDLHAAHGHIQEVIVQNFRAKPRTPMRAAPEPDIDDLLWSIAAARLILGARLNIQAPPNLSADDFGRLLDAGINDWGGISPVTPDHVNPEAPWPAVDRLRAATEARGRTLVRRLPVYPGWGEAEWQAPAMRALLRAHEDSSGFARDDAWSPGLPLTPPPSPPARHDASPGVAAILARPEALGEAEIVALFSARGADVEQVCAAADRLRVATVGDALSYAVNRNINYTNICVYACGFCAFSKGGGARHLRGPAYDLDMAEIARRVVEAEARGATEVCLQGGIHPRYTGDTYLRILRTVRAASPTIHIHAFSPLEVDHGAATLGLALDAYLRLLQAEGLGSLPGTAAEILDDEVRAVICPDKLDTARWLEVIETAHRVGLRTTATIMFGHVERPLHWARHLLRLRALQERTGGLTEFVPLPFVHMEAPMALKGRTRHGPTWREVRLMHAVSRIVLHGQVANIQTSWVKLGAAGAAACLAGGANDLGGTLMNESISRAAGTAHGQEMPPEAMDALAHSLDRRPSQRTTLYGAVTSAQRARALDAAPLTPLVQTPPARALAAAE